MRKKNKKSINYEVYATRADRFIPRFGEDRSHNAALLAWRWDRIVLLHAQQFGALDTCAEFNLEPSAVMTVLDVGAA